MHVSSEVHILHDMTLLLLCVTNAAPDYCVAEAFFVRVPFLKLGSFNFEDPSPSAFTPSDSLDTLFASLRFVRSFGVRDFALSTFSPSF